jgi:hypothetical protein
MFLKQNSRASGETRDSNPWRMAKWVGCALMLFVLTARRTSAAPDGLRAGVYCTAGEVQQILTTPDGKERVLRAIQPLKVSRLFLEGRRGDEYVPPEQLRELRDFFAAKGIQCSGGIATVPGGNFGVRQTGGLDWLNWESSKTQADVAEFFSQNAPVFDQIIVDDFFCTGDVSPESERARGGRPWGDYRRDLLVSLIEPMIVKPMRAANRRTQLILKFPQWYDRFHLFGYDPARMPERFEQVWVGTEVRDPNTPRWGFQQPTEGYMNFRWLSSVAGKKVRGAWFDHIECSAQNFVDQAYESVLAGARELTLFHLGDLLTPHPGDQLLAERMPELHHLADRIRGKLRRGIAFYKPPGAESAENMYLAGYLGMIGLPILPVAQYPKDARVAFLPVQAAADATLLDKMRSHLKRGASLVVTPALLRALGPEAAKLAGVEPVPASKPAQANQVQLADRVLALSTPLEMDAAIKAGDCEVKLDALIASTPVPLLTTKAVGRGRLLVLNLRTFSEQDFCDTGEWLLAPKSLGLSGIPDKLADVLRNDLLAPLGVDFYSPPRIAFVLFGDEACVYSFRDDAVRVRFGSRAQELPPHGWAWLKQPTR